MESFTFHLPLFSGLLPQSGGVVTTLAIIAAVVAAIVSSLRAQSLYPGFAVFGVNPKVLSYTDAKAKFVKSAKQILFDGFKTFSGPFQVVTPAGPKVIFPGRYANELKNIKDLTLTGFVKADLFPFYPGFEAQQILFDSNVLLDTIRIKLTQSLGPVSIDLCKEADVTIDEIYSKEPGWHLFNNRKHNQDLVACLSTRVFLGEQMRRNTDWIRISVDYTLEIFAATYTLRMFPAVIRPLVHWILPPCHTLRTECKLARKIIDEEILKRRKHRAELLAQGLPIPKTSDSLGWMEELTKPGQKIDYAGGQLSLTSAAIHTTADQIAKCLYRISLDPELAQALRNEIIDILKTDGWKKTSLYKMKLLDSFMKEVQRLHPSSYTTIARYAEEDVKLKDGTMIHKGTQLQILGDRMLDPELYPKPEEFDAWRYLKLRSRQGEENHWQFVTTSEEHIGFGHGIHACPGRFFASNEVKVAICFLLLRFDWKMDETNQGGGTFGFGAELILNPNLKMLYRRREPEIDIMSYI